MYYCLYYQSKLILQVKCDNLLYFRGEINKMLKSFCETNNIGNFSKSDFNKIFTTKRKQYKGFEYYMYKNNNDIKQFVNSQYNRNKKAKKELKSYNYFYVYDCETTSIDDNTSLCYLYGFQRFDYSTVVTDDNITSLAHKYNAFRSCKKFAKRLDKLNLKAKQDNKKLVIYAHNLIYDLFELLQNVVPLMTVTDYEIINCYNDSIYRGSASKPLVFRLGNLFFIDSYALTNKSLAKVSQSHSIKKQVELKTYNEKYFFQSDLPKEELIYNEYDLLVTALAVFDSIKACKQLFNTFDDFIKQHVNTITGLSKYLNKTMYSDNELNKRNIKVHNQNASNNLPMLNGEIDVDRLLFYQSVFLGGYTHCNPLTAFRVITDKVISNDKKSDYPQQMLTRLFPYNFKVVKKDLLHKLLDYHNENLSNVKDFIKDNLKAEFDIISYFKPHKHYFLAQVKIDNLSVKFFQNNNVMPCIPVSNTNLTNVDIIDSETLLIDNGKLIKCNKSFTLYCTDLDLHIYSIFYNFDIVDCLQLEHTQNVHFLDSYIQDTLRYHLTVKDSLSKVIKGKINIAEATDYDNKPLFNNSTLEYYNTLSELEQERFLDFEYMCSKMNGINNQYGINVQKIVNDDIRFNLKDYTYIKNKNVLQGCSNGTTTRDFISGLYITSYARYDLALFTYMIYSLTDCTCVYWDTDSVKTMVKDKKQEKQLTNVVKMYNKAMEKVQDYINKKFGYMFGLGIFENDFTYDSFYSMGAKKYLTQIDNSIHITNSGINKHLFSDFLTEQFKKGYTFTELVNNFYHPNIILGYDIVKKLCIKYPQFHKEKVNKEFIDDNGKKCRVSQYTSPINIQQDYDVMNINNNLMNKIYFDFTQRLQLLFGMGENKINTEIEVIKNE